MTAKATVHAVPAGPAERAAFRQATGADESAWPAPLDLAELASRDPEPPRFLVDGWLPAGYASLIAGHGGVGKSAITLHLAVCMAMGATWAGMPVEPRRVLYLSCEDREGVLHWRLDRICRHLRISLAEVAGTLDIVELVGHDAVLWSKDPHTGNCFTPAYGRLAERMQASRADVLMVDGVSDTYDGSGGSKIDTKRFVNALVRLIKPATGAVLLIGHVNRATAANPETSEGYDGNAGWHNAVRSRWYLRPESEESEAGGRERTGRLQLELQKSNLGPGGSAIRWCWDDDANMFLPEAPVTEFDRKHQQREDRRDILRALKACAQAGISVPAATTGRRTAYHVLAAQSAFPASMNSKAAVRRFWGEMEQLRAMKHVSEGTITRTDRHKVVTLELTAEGLRACD